MNCTDDNLINSLNKHGQIVTLRGFSGEILHKARPDQSNYLDLFLFSSVIGFLFS